MWFGALFFTITTAVDGKATRRIPRSRRGRGSPQTSGTPRASAGAPPPRRRRNRAAWRYRPHLRSRRWVLLRGRQGDARVERGALDLGDRDGFHLGPERLDRREEQVVRERALCRRAVDAHADRRRFDCADADGQLDIAPVRAGAQDDERCDVAAAYDDGLDVHANERHAPSLRTAYPTQDRGPCNPGLGIVGELQRWKSKKTS